MLFNHLVTRATNLCEPELRFERRFLSVTHNYGLIRAQPLPGGGHRVELDLRAWQPATQTLRSAARVSATPRS